MQTGITNCPQRCSLQILYENESSFLPKYPAIRGWLNDDTYTRLLRITYIGYIILVILCYKDRHLNNIKTLSNKV